MTNTQPLTDLTPERRRVMAAEALGWKKLRKEWRNWDGPDIQDLIGQIDLGCDTNAPDPDSNPADALALIEAMRKEGYSVDIYDHREGWACELGDYKATEPTFCRAVTSAFLIAKNLAI